MCVGCTIESVLFTRRPTCCGWLLHTYFLALEICSQSLAVCSVRVFTASFQHTGLVLPVEL